MAHILYMISLRERGSYAFQLALSEMEPWKKVQNLLITWMGRGGGGRTFHRLDFKKNLFVKQFVYKNKGVICNRTSVSSLSLLEKSNWGLNSFSFFIDCIIPLFLIYIFIYVKNIK